MRVSIDGDEIARVAAPDAETFERDYLRPRRPVVLTGCPTPSWTLERIAEAHPSARVSVRWSPRGRPQVFAGDPQRAFSFELMRLDHALAEIDGAVAERDGARIGYVQLCELRKLARLAPDVTTPSYVGKRFRSPTYLWISGRDAVNPLHFDFNHVLLAQVLGHKRFVLFPPTQSARIARRGERTLFRTTSLDIMRPDTQRFPDLPRAHIATVGPGDLLYIPYRWWHGMTATAPTISLTWWWEPSVASHLRDTARETLTSIAKRVLRA